VDTLPNTFLPPGQWVDLYAATGITVGTQIVVQNIGVCDVYLASQSAEPPIPSTAHQILRREQESFNDYEDAGAWAYCLAGGGVNVRLL
jgi:hypothetical protein